MKLLQLITLQVAADVKNIKLSRKSKRKIKKAANTSIDAAVSVASDVLKGLRKQK